MLHLELDRLWEVTAKYGLPYFANFVGADLSPDDVTPIYSSLTQLSVNCSNDVFEVLDLQDDLQSRYIGGTVLSKKRDENICKGWFFQEESQSAVLNDCSTTISSILLPWTSKHCWTNITHSAVSTK